MNLLIPRVQHLLFSFRSLSLNRSTVSYNARARLAVFAAALSAAFPWSLNAEIVPSSRMVNWIPGVTVGVPGGIPTNRTHLIDVTQAPYNADKNGSANAQPAIQAAVNAAQDGQ